MTKYILILAALFFGCTNSEKKNSVNNPTYVASPAKAGSSVPHLFTDGNGATYLSWIEKEGSENYFKFSTLKDNLWSEPLTIARGENWFVNWADYPMLAATDQELIAHYLSKSGEGTFAYDIMLVSSHDKGKTWSNQRVLHDDGKEAEHGFVSLLPYGDDFFVAWLDGRNTAMEGMEHHEGHHGEMSVRAVIVDKSGAKIKEWELDKRVCDCCQTSAAMTGNGPIVIYRDRSDEEIRDMSIVRLVDGQWTKPQTIYSDNWKIAGCPVNGPRVDAMGNNLAIAWFSSPEGNAKVRVIFSSDGGATFGEPVQVDEGKAIGRVDVAMLDDDQVMASWMEGAMIKAVKVNRDGSKESPITIASSSDARSSGFPQMTKSGSELIFAWTDDKEKIIKTARITW